MYDIGYRDMTTLRSLSPTEHEGQRAWSTARGHAHTLALAVLREKDEHKNEVWLINYS